MGKRSNFERIEKDQYFTPIKAVKPLIPFLPEREFTYAEPCAGDGALIRHLNELTGYSRASCLLASDIDPQSSSIKIEDAMNVVFPEKAEMIITNPPWTRKILHPMIEKFSEVRPTWLLFDANWIFTKQAVPYIDKYLVKMVSIGRIKWIEDSPYAGKDDCAWYFFTKDAREISPYPEFHTNPLHSEIKKDLK